MKRSGFALTERSQVVSGYICDTNVLSALLLATHSRHGDVRAAIGALNAGATQFISAIAVAELEFGVHLAEIDTGRASPDLRNQLARAQKYAVLEITRHTSAAYAELKANLARKYLKKALKRDGRPRWVEDWADKASGKVLQVDENDLWICAQGKERNLTVVTTDGRMRRIADADYQVRLHIV